MHRDHIKLFLCGDVMTGRGIDQVLPNPVDPQLHEQYVASAKTYVELAEKRNGPITQPLNFDYIWGDALSELERADPDMRLINLETAVTKSDDYWRGKRINYRMSADNIGCISVAKIDCCALANNHVLDWGYAGLKDTLRSLKKNGLKIAGAGVDIREAQAPAVIGVPGKGRVLVYSLGSETSGIPQQWAATESREGINLIDDFSSTTVRKIARQIKTEKKSGDIALVSIHWGGNWGYDIEDEYSDFAHNLIDEAGVDIIHGHSSHHPRGIELYKGKLILYGCGDFINDYEGIRGYEEFRGDLTLMYFPRVDSMDGKLVSMDMVPMQIKRFRLNRASQQDSDWLNDVLNKASRNLGTHLEVHDDTTLVLQMTQRVNNNKMN